MNPSIAFVGAGKMVSAIVKSLLRANSFSPEQISCCSAKDGTSEKLSEETGILRFDSVESMVAQSPSVLVLGC
ncbi:MAG: NAD(P)-binding domain-containing protein, partial [Opitutales bacterium]